MEATGVYWRFPYYVLGGMFDELWLCNAQHVKNVPGRKSDLSDAEWLADVAAHGMVRPSFVPPPEIRELRELTRYPKTQVDARAREIQRQEKVLQDADIKLTSVASAVWSMSSREIIEALISGTRDPSVLAQMAKGRMRGKVDRLEEALSGHFGAHHAVVCRQIIDHIDVLDHSITALTEEVTTRLVPFECHEEGPPRREHWVLVGTSTKEAPTPCCILDLTSAESDSTSACSTKLAQSSPSPKPLPISTGSVTSPRKWRPSADR